MLETADHGEHGARRIAPRPSDSIALVVCGQDGPHTVALAPDVPFTIGRHSSCDLMLSDPTLSRFHARFVRHASSVTVEDLQSRNGVWLAGRRVERAELELGAFVRLGEVAVALMNANVEARGSAREQNQTARRSLAAPPSTAAGEALYVSERMRSVRALLQRAASSELPVIICGETGTGKELAAHELHRHGPRRKGPLRVLNCAAIPPHLVESTLFGHERGAFTGADRARPGIFEEARGGIVFLDEVGELSLSAQAALLRVLECRRVARVGSTREIEVDVRIVSATHRDLHALAARGEFRVDTLHRLCVLSIELPPLRERREEIATLARHFLAQGEGAREIDAHALLLLEGYAWPGNVRQLRNVLLRASALAPGPCIGPSDLPEDVRGGARQTEAMLAPVPEPGAAALRSRLKSVERAELMRALAEARGNQRRAAALLSLPLRTFERRLALLRKS